MGMRYSVNRCKITIKAIFNIFVFIKKYASKKMENNYME